MVNADRMTRVDPITAQPIPVRDIKIAFDEVGDRSQWWWILMMSGIYGT